MLPNRLIRVKSPCFGGSFEQLVGKSDRASHQNEAGSQVFLRVTNFKSLRQVASYAI